MSKRAVIIHVTGWSSSPMKSMKSVGMFEELFMLFIMVKSITSNYKFQKRMYKLKAYASDLKED